MVFGCLPHFNLTRSSSVFIAPGLADRRSFSLQSLFWVGIKTSSSVITCEAAREDQTISGAAASDYCCVLAALTARLTWAKKRCCLVCRLCTKVGKCLVAAGFGRLRQFFNIEGGGWEKGVSSLLSSFPTSSSYNVKKFVKPAKARDHCMMPALLARHVMTNNNEVRCMGIMRWVERKLTVFNKKDLCGCACLYSFM